MLYLSVSDYWVNWHEIGWGLYQINIPYIWTIGLVKNNTGHCISQLVCVLWLINLAGCTSLHSPLNLKGSLNWYLFPLFKSQRCNIYCNNLVFSFPTVYHRTLLFLLGFMACTLHGLTTNYSTKNLVINWQWGPRTPAVRGIDTGILLEDNY